MAFFVRHMFLTDSGAKAEYGYHSLIRTAGPDEIGKDGKHLLKKIIIRAIPAFLASA